MVALVLELSLGIVLELHWSIARLSRKCWLFDVNYFDTRAL